MDVAGILDYLMENYHQCVYDRRLNQIVSEQNEALENGYFQLKKKNNTSMRLNKGNELSF